MSHKMTWRRPLSSLFCFLLFIFMMNAIAALETIEDIDAFMKPKIVQAKQTARFAVQTSGISYVLKANRIVIEPFLRNLPDPSTPGVGFTVAWSDDEVPMSGGPRPEVRKVFVPGTILGVSTEPSSTPRASVYHLRSGEFEATEHPSNLIATEDVTTKAKLKVTFNNATNSVAHCGFEIRTVPDAGMATSVHRLPPGPLFVHVLRHQKNVTEVPVDHVPTVVRDRLRQRRAELMRLQGMSQDIAAFHGPSGSSGRDFRIRTTAMPRGGEVPEDFQLARKRPARPSIPFNEESIVTDAQKILRRERMFDRMNVSSFHLPRDPRLGRNPGPKVNLELEKDVRIPQNNYM